MSAISRKSLTPLRSCYKTSSEKTKSPSRLAYRVASLPLGTLAELTGVRAMIETYPLAKAAEAYARMMSGNAQFRVVLTM
jgi:hypothetical protein